MVEKIVSSGVALLMGQLLYNDIGHWGDYLQE